MPKTGLIASSENSLPVLIIGAGKQTYLGYGNQSVFPSESELVIGETRHAHNDSGCTGLAIANGLKKHGIPAIVFEKNAALLIPGDRDWNMGFHWALPSLEALVPESFFAQLQSLQVDPHTPTKSVETLSFVNGSTGKVILEQPVPLFYRLRRSKLRTLLSNEVDVRWNKRLHSIVREPNGSSVTAVFEDGARVRGRLLLGVDGSRSTVRHLLLGPERAALKRLPYAATWVSSRYSREQALFLRSFHPLYIAAAHPDNSFAFMGLQDVPDPDRPESWTFFFYISHRSSLEEQAEQARTFGQKERVSQLKSLGKRYTDPWKSAVDWTGESQQVWCSGMAVWDPREEQHCWGNLDGRVTLAGDAAHPMTYQRGQGLNHSITDAWKLVQSLSVNNSQAEAIDEYEAEMKKRAGEEVQSSEVNTVMVHDWEQIQRSPLFKTGLGQG